MICLSYRGAPSTKHHPTVRGVKTGYYERSRVHRHAMWNNAPIDLKIGPELDTLVLYDTYVGEGHMMKSSYPTVAKCAKFPILTGKC